MLCVPRLPVGGAIQLTLLPFTAYIPCKMMTHFGSIGGLSCLKRSLRRFTIQYGAFLNFTARR